MKKIAILTVAIACFINLLGNTRTATVENDTPQIFKDYEDDIDFIAQSFDSIDNTETIAELMTEWAAIMCPYTTSNHKITTAEKDSLNKHTLKAFESAYYAFLKFSEEDFDYDRNKSLYEAGFKPIADTVAVMTRKCNTFGHYTKVLAEYIDPGIICNVESSYTDYDRGHRKNNDNRTSNRPVKTTTESGHYSSSTKYVSDCGSSGRENNTGRSSNKPNNYGIATTPEQNYITDVNESDDTTRPNDKVLTETETGYYSPGISEKNYFIPEGCTPEVSAYLRFYGEIYEKSLRCSSKQEFNNLMSDCTPELMRFMKSTEQLNDVTRTALVESSLYYAPRIAMVTYQVAGLNIDKAFIAYIIGERSGIKTIIGDRDRANLTEEEIKILDELLNVIPSTRKMLYEIAGKSNTLGEFLNNIQTAVVQISKAVTKAKRTLLR